MPTIMKATMRLFRHNAELLTEQNIVALLSAKMDGLVPDRVGIRLRKSSEPGEPIDHDEIEYTGWATVPEEG